MTDAERDAHNELSAYTLAHGLETFIHQHVVDAFAAQQADEHSKPVTVAFALVGLYLHLEQGDTGREVQQAHMRLGRRKQVWPTFTLPLDRGAITAIDVMKAPEGEERHRAIDAWCASVWAAYAPTSRNTVEEFLRANGERVGSRPR